MVRTKKKAYLFDQSDVGQHIDGALGEKHAMSRMAELLTEVRDELPLTNYSRAANALLIDYDEGDFDEEFENEWLDDATDVLQDATEDGLVWEWEAGDLVLLDEGDDDEE